MSITLTDVSFDKVSYTPGETVTLTMTYASGDYTGSLTELTSFTLSVTLTDSSGSATFTSDSDQPSFTFGVIEPGNAAAEDVSASVTDSGHRTWVQQSSTVTSFQSSTGQSQGTIVLTTTA